MSPSPLVMLMTQPSDAAIHWVASELDALGVDHFFYDLSAFPLESNIDCHIASGATWRVLISYGGRQIDLSAVTGIWNGHVSDFNFGDKLHKDVIRYAKAECAECVGGILRSIEPIVWMNHPDAGLRASYKPYQLHVASSVGLAIPATMISNNPHELREFYRHFGGQIVCKSFHIDSNPRPGLMLRAPYTTLVSDEDLQNLDSCVPCSTMFQEYVPQLYALRLIYLPQEIYGVEIHSSDGRLGYSAQTRDWRSIYNDLTYKVHQVPVPLANKIRHLMLVLGLNYGAIDMLVRTDGTYVFLEVNPMGAWGWLQEHTGLPIARSIAKALANKT